jgi:peptidoglycan hydrolase-like protein with peptidoglycan-binding domain
VPRAIAIDDDSRRPAARRTNGKRGKQTGKERGLLLRLLLRNPRDTIAIGAAAVAVLAILVNALFLQAGRHPSPMFAAPVTSPPQLSAPPKVAAVASETTNPLPRPRPSEADTQPSEMPKADDAVGNLVRATSMPAAPSSSARVAAVQRALTDYGYGQIKPTGTIGADTQAAIQRFERERKMPITGQMSERLVRELGIATGKPIQ